MRYELSAQARLDLFEIWSYIADFNMEAADRLTAGLRYTMQLLADFPRMGRVYDRDKPDLYCHPHGKYLIFYRHGNDVITIHRILHSARYIKHSL